MLALRGAVRGGAAWRPRRRGGRRARCAEAGREPPERARHGGRGGGLQGGELVRERSGGLARGARQLGEIHLHVTGEDASGPSQRDHGDERARAAAPQDELHAALAEVDLRARAAREQVQDGLAERLDARDERALGVACRDVDPVHLDREGVHRARGRLERDVAAAREGRAERRVLFPRASDANAHHEKGETWRPGSAVSTLTGERPGSKLSDPHKARLGLKNLTTTTRNA